MATINAHRRGTKASRHRLKSALGLNTCICPERKLRVAELAQLLLGANMRPTHQAKYPRPLNEKLLWPLGKLLQASCSICSFFCVQTVHGTSPFPGVPLRGIQREIKSGRGLPIAFFRTSVRNEVSVIVTRNPSIVTWTLCEPGRNMAAQRTRMRNGIIPA